MQQTNPLIPASFDLGAQLGSVLSIVFLFVLAGYIIYAVILHYHWQQYGSNKIATFWTYVVFAASTLPLIATAGIITLTF